MKSKNHCVLKAVVKEMTYNFSISRIWFVTTHMCVDYYVPIHSDRRGTNVIVTE